MSRIQTTAVKIPSNIPWSKSNEVVQTLSLVTYNILGKVYASPQWFPYCENAVLQFSTRSKLILQELQDLEANLICLQELDEFSFWESKLSELGYVAVYFGRSSKSDGCGIFYMPNKLKLQKHQGVNFPDKFDRIGLMCSFSLVQSKGIKNNTIVVATTHLYWDNSRVDVQFQELKYFLDSLAKFNVNQAPTIVTGDFNSLPEQPLYKFMQTMQSPNPKKKNDDSNLYFKFASAYSNYAGTGKEPLYTTFKPNWNGCIDYIWYWSKTESLSPLSILTLPEAKELMKEKGLPNSVHGSDHLPLYCEFGISRY
eukprot:TRINITY_DN6489_c0_g1_i1.p1 TRINITY_DN6489_c0_g1~~TRINITY_DN6489_c0_g1_i1.p1  ORF type:complete len:311 (-),score=40.25 TRINITY_DN6489_c0_g1_i1:37-969(-)